MPDKLLYYTQFGLRLEAMMKYIPRTAVLSALILFFCIIFLFLSYTKLRRDSVPPFSKTDLEETDLDKIRQQVEQINPFFIKNKGQAPEDILYYFQGNNGAVYFTKEKIVFQNKYPIASEESSTTTLLVREGGHQMRFEGQQDDVMISAEDKQEATLNYFVSGVDVTDIPTYGKIIFRNIYPHIDAVFFFADNKLNYDIVIHPNGNPEDIQLAFEGIDELTVDHTGKLLLKTDAETVVHEAPHTYQQDGGSNISVSASYVVNRDNTVSINFGQYDLSRDVIIDPTFSSLAASTFLGGSSSDVLNGLVSDVTGNIYITGYTWSFIFPTTTEAYDEVFNGVTDVFVSKFSSDLATLSASTFIGGADTDQAGAIALDSSGNVYITGYTVSTNFPTSTGVYGQSNSGGDEVFVAKLNSSLSSLSAATYLGNSGNERANALALSADESSVYVTGYTWSGSFPTIGAYDNSLAGLQDVFVSKLSADLTTLSASTFVGGSDADQANALVLDSADNVYITGYTVSTNFPTSTGVYGQSNSGGDEVFVAKLNSSLSSLSAATYLGNSGNERASSLALSADESSVYVTGYTWSGSFPTIGAYDNSLAGLQDVFVSKLSADLTTLSASTFVGGSDADQANALVLDSADNVYITGYTVSTNFPTSTGVYGQSNSGGDEVFVAKLNSSLSSLSAATYLGNSGNERANALALSADESSVYVTGYTWSGSFPTIGAYDNSLAGLQDVFVSKLSADLTTLSASTFVGGSDADQANALVLDSADNVYITGYTVSTNFPTSTGVYGQSNSGGDEVFVAKLNSSLSS